MKKIFYSAILLMAVSFSANAQLKNTDKKWKNNFLQRMYQNQKFGNHNQIFGSKKVNPYWLNVDAPHLRNSYSPQVKVPTFNSVWTHIGFDSLGNDTKWFLRTADGGKTWRFDTIQSPEGYVIGSISPVDGNICYASMYNQAVGLGGGIFKTIDGGATWKQLAVGKIFDANSFVDFVYFFDAENGLAVGDANGLVVHIWKFIRPTMQVKHGSVFQAKTFRQPLVHRLVFPSGLCSFLETRYGLEDMIVMATFICIAPMI